MARSATATTRRSRRTKTASTTPYPALKAALQALPPTRTGFEGLVAALLAEATGQRLRLTPSGDQQGVDGVGDRASSRLGAPCKPSATRKRRRSI